MRPKSSKSDSYSNSDEPSSSDSRDSKIGVYCTLRSRHSDQKQKPSADLEDYAIKDTLSNYCTVGRRLKNFIKTTSHETETPYTKLQESATEQSFLECSTNFGISNDLSTESIKNACDFYDLSDDEPEIKQAEAVNSSLLEKIESKLNNFRRSTLRSSARSATCDRKRRYENFHPYCTIRRKIENLPTLKNPPTRQGSMKLNQDSAEAFHILNELDAILDNHETAETTSLSSPPTRGEPEKIEDCLYELDAYLEQIDRISTSSGTDNNNQMDIPLNSLQHDQSEPTATMMIVRPKIDNGIHLERSKTLPKKLLINSINDAQSKNSKMLDTSLGGSTNNLRRGHLYRSTIGGAVQQPTTSDNRSNSDDVTKDKLLQMRKKSWRRHSMRKTALLVLPDHQQNTGNQPSSSSTPQQAERLNSGNDNPASRSDLLTTPQEMSTSGNPTNTLEDFRLYNTVNFNANNISTDIHPNPRDVIRCISHADCILNRNNLTHIDIINDILSNSSLETDQQRPRQVGRRASAHPRVVSIMAETNSSGNACITVSHDRPMSAPARTDQRTLGNAPSNHRYVSSGPSSVASSRNPSPVSLLSSTASSSMASTSAVSSPNTSHQRSDPIDAPANDREEISHNAQWPHGFSRTLALLCCTFGLFNISRFAVLTIVYGGNFLVQFFVLSMLFGIPMLWLQMCLGAKIKSGPVSMWKISPICKGIGISLTLAQCAIALYSAVSLGWVLVYFRDSFISRNDRYRWQEPFHMYERFDNITIDITDTVADYFNGVVLQRWQLGYENKTETNGVRFQLAFNVAIIWTAIFIFLCKGLKSFGKIVLGLTLLPLVIFIVICCKFLYVVDFSTVQHIFSATDFEMFLVSSKSWTAAAQETFLTWGLLGPSVIAISAKSAEKSEGKTILRRDAILVVLLTLFGLSIAAIMGYACVQILKSKDYIYFPGSYENIDSSTSVYCREVPLSLITKVPVRSTAHYSTVMGDYYRRSMTPTFPISGYQSLRFVTELFPATVAVATQEYISPIWTIMTYLMFLIFGLAQLCAMWKPISSALGNSTSSVLLSCVTGLLLGIPFATEMGITIIHYLDTIIGGSWWLLILWVAQIFGVFLIRGRPYNGDVLVNDLRLADSMSAFLALSWNVLLPIGLIALSIVEYKAAFASHLFHWRLKTYYPLWARKLGGLAQIGFLLLVPVTAIVQIYRYLSSGPPDIFDRIQLLYRPPPTPQDYRRPRPNNDRGPNHQQPVMGITLTNLEAQTIQDDAPPKYTPPPSYTTATGARLAKLLRQSIRRSVRRILGEPSRPRPSIPTGPNSSSAVIHDSSLPPEYSTVLCDPSGEECLNQEIGPRALYNSHTQRSQSLERYRAPSLRRQQPTAGGTFRSRNAQTFTAFDVAQILRTSHRHERSASAIATCMDTVLRTSSLRNKNCRSAENLVMNVAPLGESNAVVNEEGTTHNAPNCNENTSVI